MFCGEKTQTSVFQTSKKAGIVYVYENNPYLAEELANPDHSGLK